MTFYFMQLYWSQYNIGDSEFKDDHCLRHYFKFRCSNLDREELGFG